MTHTVRLPEVWVRTRLREVAHNIRRRSNPQDYPDLRFIGMDNVEAHTMRLLGTVPASEMKSSATHFQPGDVLYGRLRPYLNKVITVDFEGLASAEFIPLTPPEGVLPELLKYRLSSADFVAFTSTLDTGDRPRVEYDQISDFEFGLPPTEEQHRIVEAIESYLTRLDDAVASLERVQRNLERYRASVLKAAVEGRLVPTEADLARKEGRSYEPASDLLNRILVERKARWIEDAAKKVRAKGNADALLEAKKKAEKKYKEPSPPDATDLPALPEGWCWVSVEQLVDVGTGATPKRGDARYWEDGNISWVGSAAVNRPYVRDETELVTDTALRETNLTIYPPGTLLVAMYGEGKTRGKCAELAIESTTNQALAALVFRASSYPLRRFIKLFMEHNYTSIRRTASGGVQPNLNLGIIKKIAIPLPPLAEQERVCIEAESLLTVGNEVERAAFVSAKRGARLRQSILKWAFDGKLVEQDPSDESASALLEQIRTETARVKS